VKIIILYIIYRIMVRKRMSEHVQYRCSFFLIIFNLRLVESVATESTDSEG
jgi:hypothetical protein